MSEHTITLTTDEGLAALTAATMLLRELSGTLPDSDQARRLARGLVSFRDKLAEAMIP